MTRKNRVSGNRSTTYCLPRLLKDFNTAKTESVSLDLVQAAKIGTTNLESSYSGLTSRASLHVKFNSCPINQRLSVGLSAFHASKSVDLECFETLKVLYSPVPYYANRVDQEMIHPNFKCDCDPRLSAYFVTIGSSKPFRLLLLSIIYSIADRFPDYSLWPQL